MLEFDVLDIKLARKENGGEMTPIRISVNPDCYIGVNCYNRGFFFCRNVTTPVSSYILLPDGGTNYANELLQPQNKGKELLGFLNGKLVSCRLEKAESPKDVERTVRYEYYEPLTKDSPYWDYRYYFDGRMVPYILYCSSDTEVLPKLVKLGGGTHFGTRVSSVTCLEK